MGAEHGLRIPTHAQLQEIESSSRLKTQGRALTLSMPLGVQDHRDVTGTVPLGFVLTPDVLVTVRYCDIHAFPDAQTDLPADGTGQSSASVFTTLLENMVDFGADRLEQIGSGLGGISQRIFGYPGHPAPARRRMTRALHQHLITIGQVGEQLSRLRESLLGLERIASFVAETADWFGPELQVRLKTVRHDLASLADFEEHLSSKTQFLLDATLGFINTEQNEMFKVLTIVSVVGVPPTLIASIYGMNFHNIHEYDWSYGYQYCIGLIVLSTVLPILWFKWRKWW